MKITMIGPNSSAKGGIATVIENSKKYFDYADTTITYLSSWDGGSLLYRFKHACQSFFQMRKQKADIVHLHVAQKGSFFRKAWFLLGSYKKSHVILHMHASSFDVFYKESPFFIKKWIRSIFNKADQVVVLSEEWRRFYETLTTTNITVIPNAVPIPSESYYHSNTKKIVTFGRIGNRKGSYDILKVAKEIYKRHPEYQFVLYGDGELDKVKQIIQTEHIPNVTLGGWVTDKKSILEETVLHFLPSYHEGLPMAILETMAAGIPNLSSTVGGIPELLTNKRNGLLTKAGDIPAMVQQIDYFLANQNVRQELSVNARQTVNDQFSIQAYNKAWHNEYKTTMTKEMVRDKLESRI